MGFEIMGVPFEPALMGVWAAAGAVFLYSRFSIASLNSICAIFDRYTAEMEAAKTSREMEIIHRSFELFNAMLIREGL